MVFVEEMSVDVPDVRISEVDKHGHAQLFLELPVYADVDDADSPRRVAPRRRRARRVFMLDVERFARGSALGGLAARMRRTHEHPPKRVASTHGYLPLPPLLRLAAGSSTRKPLADRGDAEANLLESATGFLPSLP